MYLLIVYSSFETLITKYQVGKKFVLDKIQEEVVFCYVAGKFEIDDCQTKLCKTFHYKHETTVGKIKLEHPTE